MTADADELPNPPLCSGASMTADADEPPNPPPWIFAPLTRFDTQPQNDSDSTSGGARSNGSCSSQYY